LLQAVAAVKAFTSPNSFKVPSGMQPTICILGLGNWGSSLAHAVTVAKLPLREVVVRKRKTGRALPLATWAQARLDADILWLCVPDSAIAPVAARIAKSRRNLVGQLVIHSSGALSLEPLQSVVDAGARVAAVHPMMSFPTHDPESLKGIPFGVEADASCRRTVLSYIRRLGGRPFVLPPGHKTLYHLAGMMASPLLVSHLVAAAELAARAGLQPQQALQVIEPITRATVDAFFRRGAGKSFSGPVARGDAETIRLHLQALEVHPMLAGVYRSLARYALETLPASERKKLRAALQRN
jgi:predicted short-subunit dehydrogenase-like oxidoreductase (DUF2520 family)